MPSFQMEIAISGDFDYAKSVSARNEDSIFESNKLPSSEFEPFCWLVIMDKFSQVPPKYTLKQLDKT